MNNIHGMNNIHDNDKNNIAECNLLHDILNYYKFVKGANYHYYPRLFGCINTRRGKARYKTF